MLFYEYLFPQTRNMFAPVINISVFHRQSTNLLLLDEQDPEPSEASSFLTPHECIFLETTMEEYVCASAVLDEWAWRFDFASFHEEADKASGMMWAPCLGLPRLPDGPLNTSQACGQGQLSKAGSLLSPRQIRVKRPVLLLWAFPPTRFCHPGQGSWWLLL